MSGDRIEQTPVLHIGWWRNGYHPYDREREPTMDPVAFEASGPTDHEIRTYGGLLAGLIAGAWLVAGIIGGLVNPDVKLTLLALLIPPVFIVYFLGRRLAVKAVKSEFRLGLPVVIRMAVVTVALNSYAVALESLTWNLVNPSYWDGSRPTLGEVLVGLAFGAILLGLIGVIAFGLIAIWPALLSAGLWSYLMRRRFSQRGLEGGVPGSGDRPRS